MGFSLAPYPPKSKTVTPVGVSEGVVLCSHVPPYGVLDECVGGGKNIGDPRLRKRVEGMVTRPAVWVCGHVHEAHGARRVNFATERFKPAPKQRHGKGNKPSRKSRKLAVPKPNSAEANRARAQAHLDAGKSPSAAFTELFLKEGGTDDMDESAACEATDVGAASSQECSTLCLNVATTNDGRATHLHTKRSPVEFHIDVETKKLAWFSISD